MKTTILALLLLAAGSRDDELLQAVRKGDTAAVKALLAAGIPADVKGRYDRTALSFAADRGHLEMVKLLLDAGADVNARDTFYKATPLTWAAVHGHLDVVRLLFARGAQGADDVLDAAVGKNDAALADAAIGSGRIAPADLSLALEAAEEAAAAAVVERLRAAGVALPPTVKLDPAVLSRYAGEYAEEGNPNLLALTMSQGALTVSFGRPFRLAAEDEVSFRVVGAGARVRFKTEGEKVVGFTLKLGDRERWYVRRQEARP